MSVPGTQQSRQATCQLASPVSHWPLVPLALTHELEPVVGLDAHDLHLAGRARRQRRLDARPHRQHRARQHVVRAHAQPHLAVLLVAAGGAPVGVRAHPQRGGVVGAPRRLRLAQRGAAVLLLQLRQRLQLQLEPRVRSVGKDGFSEG